MSYRKEVPGSRLYWRKKKKFMPNGIFRCSCRSSLQKKEKFILQRILGEKPVSRTDYEYYSRKTKKKLNAIIHLRNFAESVLPLFPKIDKELFELKKLLEEWGEREGYRGYSLARFIAAGNVLSISLKGKKGGQRHTVLLKNSSKINNKRLRELAEKYQGHNFEE